MSNNHLGVKLNSSSQKYHSALISLIAAQSCCGRHSSVSFTVGKIQRKLISFAVAVAPLK